MRYLLLLSTFISVYSFAKSLRDTCDNWNKLRPHLFRLHPAQKSGLEAFWMKAEGFESSEFFFISEKSQKSFSMSDHIRMPVYEGYLVCTEEGLESAKAFAEKKRGKGFYSRIVFWDAPFEEVFWKELSFPRGLKDPIQGVFGVIKEGPIPEFHDIWIPYKRARDKYFLDYRCDYDDYKCIREAQETITAAFKSLMQKFSPQIKNRFERKRSLLDELRELTWEYQKA